MEDIKMALFSKKKSPDSTEIALENENTVQQVDNDQLDERDLFENTDYKDGKDDKDIPDLIDEVIEYFTQVDPIKLNMLERGKLRKEVFVADVKRYINSIESDPKKEKRYSMVLSPLYGDMMY